MNNKNTTDKKLSDPDNSLAIYDQDMFKDEISAW